MPQREARPESPHGNRVVEVKRYPDGRQVEFPCTLVREESGHMVISFISTYSKTLSGLELPVGMISYGHYWPDRPYNVYHWMRPDGSTIACYVNISDQTVLEPGRVTWCDLYLDVLLKPDGSAEVLDRDELPPDMDPDLRDYAEAAVRRVLREQAAIFKEAEEEPARPGAAR